MIKVSAYLIVKNEEKRIEKTLKAISKVADEIIVVDSGSTDNSLKIAKQYGAQCLFHQWQSYAHQKNFAQNRCHFDWLLSVDADEVLSDELIAEILRLKQIEPPFKAYNVRIGEMYQGFQKPSFFSSKYNIIRFYHKRWATMEASRLSEDRICLTQKTKIGQFKGLMYHYSFLNISHQIAKMNYYTDEVVKTSQKKSKHYSTMRLLTEFPRQFFIYYFKKRQFLNGFWGFVVSMDSAFFRFVKIAKCIERDKNA